MPKTEPQTTAIAIAPEPHGQEVNSGLLLELLVMQAGLREVAMAEVTGEVDGRSEQFLVIVAGGRSIASVRDAVARSQNLVRSDLRTTH